MQLRPLAQRVAQRHEATLGNVVGHRLLVYFGYPQAHEDDARRAVRAGARPDRRGRRAPRRRRRRRQRRQAGAAGRHPYRPGRRLDQPEHAGAGRPRHHTRRRACACRRVAAPGTIVISPATRSLVRRGFATEAQAPLPPIGGVEALSRTASARRAAAGDEVGFDLAPLVGRARELDQLDQPVGAGARRHRTGGPAQRRARASASRGCCARCARRSPRSRATARCAG